MIRIPTAHTWALLRGKTRIHQSICSIGSLKHSVSIYLSSLSNRPKEQRPMRHCPKVVSRLVHITGRNSALLALVRGKHLQFGVSEF